MKGAAPKPPIVAHFSLTDACNLSCLHCDIWKRKVGSELKLEQWEKIVEQLSDWLGPFILKIAGGEPLVRKWLPDLISFARKRDIFVGVSSNGMLLDRPAVHRLLDAGLNEINISLDSLNPGLHDHVRNTPGCHQSAVQALRYFKESGAKVEINVATVIMDQNIDELVDIAWWVKENGLRTLTFQPLMQNFGADYDPAWYKTSPFFPRRIDLLNRVIDELIEFRKKYWIVGNHENQLNMMKFYFENPEHEPLEPCAAGVGDVGFDPFGNLYLCFNLDPVGNILEKTPQEIFFGDSAARRRTDIARCKRSCYLLNCVAADEVFD